MESDTIRDFYSESMTGNDLHVLKIILAALWEQIIESRSRSRDQ